MKPTPSVIRLITNASKRGVNPNEPQPEGPVRKPDWLEGTASEVWDEYAPQLTELGLLTSIDTLPFCGLCILAARMRDEPDKMRSCDFGQLRLLAVTFGMAPTERARFTESAGKDKASSRASLR
jgi:phage terminase small subunit